MAHRLLPTVLVPLLLCAGCFAPDRRTPEPAPERFTESLDSGQSLPDRWWTAFGSPELEALIATALAGNPGLEETWARLDQARAASRAAGAARWPALDASGGRTTTRVEGLEHRDLYTGGLTATFEVDLWGRVSAQRSSAKALEAAARADLEAAATTLVGEVALRWVRIGESRSALALTEQQCRIAQTQLDLLRLRQRLGQASRLEVITGEQNLATLQASLPLTQARLAVTGHELAALLGQPPGTTPPTTANILPDLLPLPNPGLPATVLTRRPDLQAAWDRLAAADWQLAAAHADRLPALRLGGTFGYQAIEVEQLFQTWSWSLAGQLLQPLLDGGRRSAEVERVRGLIAERLATYRRLALVAWREVEDALVQERRQIDHLAVLDRQIALARQAVAQATDRQRNGLADHLPVLGETANLHRLERDRLTRKREQCEFRILLGRALGGTWSTELLPPEKRR